MLPYLTSVRCRSLLVHAVVRELDWSRPQTWTEPESTFDVIIGADITYYLDTLSDLVRTHAIMTMRGGRLTHNATQQATVIDMASSSRTLVLLAHEHRKVSFPCGMCECRSQHVGAKVEIDRKIETAFAKIRRKLVEIPRV